MKQAPTCGECGADVFACWTSWYHVNEADHDVRVVDHATPRDLDIQNAIDRARFQRERHFSHADTGGSKRGCTSYVVANHRCEEAH